MKTDLLPLPHPGQLIDGFELEEVIGVGGMGAVFRARDVNLEREVALKLIPQGQSDDPEVVQRFYQEGRSAARLDHENIARVYSIGQDPPYHFIVFEYIAGETLRRRVDRQGPLDVGDAINYTLQIASALVHASERGVVHRDIKPSNIIITPQGRAKLVDMGLARRFEREEDHGLTQSGMTLGTFDYISPEQARDPRDVDVRSDLYSLGCTLFHMLTGRPPFVGGTVLQKLLQHQEESPPDVREFNPMVSADLAGVLAKLLAKDPDRRYQTPEQLVRDLLVLSGSTASGPGATVGGTIPGLAPGRQPPWIGHLVWAVPIFAFILVVGGLVWWGRELNGPIPSNSLEAVAKTVRKSAEEVRTDRPGGLGASPNLDDPGEAGAERTAEPAVHPRNISVGSNEDLLARIEAAPPHAIIGLADDGPYQIGDREKRGRIPFIMKQRDLTIRAEPGNRPVITLSEGFSPGEAPPAALFDLAGGRITIEGVEFRINGTGWRTPPVAIRTEETDLTLRRCTFRAVADEGGEGASVVWFRAAGAAIAAGDRTPAVRAERSHFSGGETIRTEGPVDLMFRDCTVGGTGAALTIDNRGLTDGPPAHVRLSHVSLTTDRGPIFRVRGESRFQVDDCAVAPAGRGASTVLLAVDDPRSLGWRGRSNLFANISTFLEPADPALKSDSITLFSRWAESGIDPREVGSRLANAPIWKLPNPLQAGSGAAENPSQSFALASQAAGADGGSTAVGARQGPLGLLIREAATGSDRVAEPQSRSQSIDDDRLAAGPPLVATAKTTRNPGGSSEVGGTSRSNSGGGPPEFLPPMAVAGEGRRAAAETPAVATASAPPEGVSSASGSTSASPMPVAPSAVVQSETADRPRVAAKADSKPTRSNRSSAADLSTDPTAADSSSNSRSPRADSAPPPEDPREIRTTREFQERLAQLGAGGGVLRIAAGADLELPAIELAGSASWRIEAGPAQSGSERRPRIRFRPDASGFNRAPLRWSVLASLRSGKLRVQGVDVTAPAAGDPLNDRIAAFGAGAGAEIELIDCTLTVAGVQTNLAAIVALGESGESRAQRDDSSSGPARIIIRDSFIRSGGDLLNVPATPPEGIDLNCVDSLLVADRSIVHARGGASWKAGGPPSNPRAEIIRIELERVTTRTREGLVHLESSLDEPRLPTASVVARDSIVSVVDSSDFLLLVDGRDQPVAALQDRISWTGKRVAYHQIINFRRDQNGITGSPPTNYNRQEWAKVAKDEEAFHDDVRFVKWDPSHPAWTTTRDDLRLSTETTRALGEIGPDLKRIPAPPDRN